MRNNKQLRKYDQFAKCDDLEKESRFTNSDGSIKTDEFIRKDGISNYGFQTRLIDAYSDWIKQHWENGWDVYLFTFVFKQLPREFNDLPGSPDNKIQRMFKEISWVYGRLLNRTFKKKARSPKWVPFLPRGIFVADRRGHRRPNNGLHVHGLVAAIRFSPIPDPLDQHFREHMDEYLIGHIEEIDVEPVTHKPKYTTKYGAKALKSRAYSRDDVWLLPKGLDELVDKTQRCPNPIQDIQAAFNVSDETAKEIYRDPKLFQVLGW